LMRRHLHGDVHTSVKQFAHFSRNIRIWRSHFFEFSKIPIVSHYSMV
jgi:hypothetical protein